MSHTRGKTTWPVILRERISHRVSRIAVKDELRTHLVALLAIGTLAMLVQSTLWYWTVDDAAISFAYAKHLVSGEGLVPFAGGERVEGFSNPLWVWFIALFFRMGMEPFFAAKLLSALCVLTSVMTVWAVVRQTRVELDLVPLIGAITLSTSATFAIWAASGLENGLFCAALALAMFLTLREGDRGGPSWSVVAWLAVVFTRPEGLLYALFGGAWWALLERVERRRFRRTALWFVLFVTPIVFYHWWRYSYFAFELPATYYAKLGSYKAELFDWQGKGWRYVAGYGTSGPGVLLLTLSVLGLVGSLKSRRLWRTHGLCLGLGVLVVAFALRAGGDWMDGYRFFSFLVVPATVLCTSGVAAVGDRVASFEKWQRASATIAFALTLLWALVNFAYMRNYTPPTSADGVKKRLDYYVETFNRLHLNRPFVAVDHDMGAFTYWLEPEVGRVIDARGLVDIPVAMHRKKPGFVDNYFFGSAASFDIAHAHASTGMLLRNHRRFQQDYVEIPGYPANDGIHNGTYLRRDLFVNNGWRGLGGRFPLQLALELVGYRIESPEITPGSSFLLELGLYPLDTLPVGTEILVGLSNDEGEIASWNVEPAFGGIYPPERWRKGEVVVDRILLPLPEFIPFGEYSLTVQVGRTKKRAVYEDAVKVVSNEALENLVGADLREARELARAGDCLMAEKFFDRARQHQYGDLSWREKHRSEFAPIMIKCFLTAMSHEEDCSRIEKIWRAAQAWNRKNPELRLRGVALAGRFAFLGDNAMEKGDDNSALRFYETAVLLDPTRSIARRRAEQSRTRLLARNHGKMQ